MTHHVRVWVSVDDEAPRWLASREVEKLEDASAVGSSLLHAAAHILEVGLELSGHELPDRPKVTPFPPAEKTPDIDPPVPRRRARPQPHSPLPPPLDNREAND